MTHVVRAVLSMSFVVGASVVVYNLKSRFCKEQAWNVSVLVLFSVCVALSVAPRRGGAASLAALSCSSPLTHTRIPDTPTSTPTHSLLDTHTHMCHFHQ